MNDDSSIADVTDPDEACTRRAEDELPSEAVVRTVADALDRDPLDLPPLHDAVDPDALDGLFADTAVGGRDGRFAFAYSGCTVVLLGPDEVVVATDD